MNVEGRHRILSIEENIAEVFICKILYNSNDENHRLAGDRAINVLKRKLSFSENGSKIDERYIVVISPPMQFDYVVSFLATRLSFNQIPIVIHCNRTVLETARKHEFLSLGEVLCTS